MTLSLSLVDSREANRCAPIAVVDTVDAGLRLWALVPYAWRGLQAHELRCPCMWCQESSGAEVGVERWA